MRGDHAIFLPRCPKIVTPGRPTGDRQRVQIVSGFTGAPRFDFWSCSPDAVQSAHPVHNDDVNGAIWLPVNCSDIVIEEVLSAISETNL
jgi:hypothetical protein